MTELKLRARIEADVKSRAEEFDLAAEMMDKAFGNYFAIVDPGELDEWALEHACRYRAAARCLEGNAVVFGFDFPDGFEVSEQNRHVAMIRNNMGPAPADGWKGGE